MATERTTGKDACEALASFINDYGADTEGFMVELNRTHRTMQQGLGRLAMLMLQRWREDYQRGSFDGRNEAVCKLANELLGSRSKQDLYLPLI
jgi:hypothetical protein